MSQIEKNRVIAGKDELAIQDIIISMVGEPSGFERCAKAIVEYLNAKYSLSPEERVLTDEQLQKEAEDAENKAREWEDAFHTVCAENEDLKQKLSNVTPVLSEQEAAYEMLYKKANKELFEWINKAVRFENELLTTKALLDSANEKLLAFWEKEDNE